MTLIIYIHPRGMNIFGQSEIERVVISMVLVLRLPCSFMIFKSIKVTLVLHNP
jgi:hypothetical protein